MADRLMRPNSGVPLASATDAGFDEGFIGFTSDPLEPPAVTHQEVVEPVLKATEPAARAPQFTPAPGARGPFLDGFTRFRDWMRQEFSATEVFILDAVGDVIFDESAHGRLHFFARSLALASHRRASAGSVHVKIRADATLELIPVETASGRMVLGAVVPRALGPAAVTAVVETLAKVARPPAAE